MNSLYNWCNNRNMIMMIIINTTSVKLTTTTDTYTHNFFNLQVNQSPKEIEIIARTKKNNNNFKWNKIHTKFVRKKAIFFNCN